jgi:hypothetical protein
MLLRRVMQQVREQNWLAVVLDFFVVVIGIWIALLITQWSEKQQRLTDLARAEMEINQELALSYLYMHERVAFAPCRLERYARLEELLLLPETQWAGEPSALSSSYRPFGTDIWNSVLQQGDLDEMASDRRLTFTSVFENIKKIDELQDAVFEAESGLRVLGRSVQMTISDRLRYYDELAVADGLSRLLEVSRRADDSHYRRGKACLPYRRVAISGTKRG